MNHPFLAKTILPACVAVCGSLFGPPAIGAEPSIEVSGIQVIRQEVGEGFQALRPFNAQGKGTKLALLMRSPDVSIIKLDVEASTLDAFIDDTRKSLLSDDSEQRGGFGSQEGFGSFPRISEDGKAAMVTISGPGVPTEKSNKIGAKGTLVAQLGSQSKTFQSDPVELKQGVSLAINGIEFKISKIGKPGFGNEPLEIGLQSSNKALTTLKGVKFFDADGNEMESKSGGSSSMGFLGNMTYGENYRLTKTLSGKTVIEFEIWTDLKEVKVPFSITAGLGG